MPLIPKQEPPYYENGTAITTKQYLGIMNQTGTDAPTTVDIINTIGNIVWTRVSAGYYRGTLLNAFPANKTITLIANGENYLDAFYRADNDTVEIYQMQNWDGVSLNVPRDQISGASIQILVYP